MSTGRSAAPRICFGSEELERRSYHYEREVYMGETSISAAEARRKFSRLLEGDRQGERFVVTRHGKPVAKILPVDVSSRA